MAQVIFDDKKNFSVQISPDLLKGKRNLTEEEILILEKNFNRNTDKSWSYFFVDENEFDPELVQNCSFDGFVILGRLRNVKLRYHDLELKTGIYDSFLRNVVTGDDNAFKNAVYLENYRFGSRVMLFNVQEMSCTNHSKFGNGILKKGEPESNRVDIGVCNENGGRAVLPFEGMITSDAFLWSRYREDPELLKRFVELTEKNNSGALDTYGTVGNDAVIKNTTLIKDAKIGDCAYIKGAFKLKNITVLSSEDEVSQIGEGVELVNGIMGYGSHVFYQAVAVRFVIGRNCQLKYGARLLNSILGDNSTVSCCELLNNLIYPFHEQHHNSSFLIATLVGGQSNIAAGATIGSNHNSRSPDGEITAGRGFWPGLCSDFKHNSRFASFVLVAKGSYQNELDILYPFSLVAPGKDGSNKISIIPAWWFLYDMFAIARNNYKFKSRDRRKVKVQHIEMNPLAPDTIGEVVSAIERIIRLTKEQYFSNCEEDSCRSDEELRQSAKDFLHKNEELSFVLEDDVCQKKFGSQIIKPAKAYKMYRKIIKYYTGTVLLAASEILGEEEDFENLFAKVQKIPLYTEWKNAGGQIIPEAKICELFEMIKTKKIDSWEQVHEFYDECEKNYPLWQARYALYLMEKLYSRPLSEFTKEIIEDFVGDTEIISNLMYSSSVSSRAKDFTDYYRCMTYRNPEEMRQVLGTVQDNGFLKTLESDTKIFNEKLRKLFL